MSTANVKSVYEQVLYLGKSKHKWEHRDITFKGNEESRKYVMEVQRVQPKLIFWKSKKPEVLELTPNSHVVIHMDTLDNHSNVIALVPLNQSCHQVRGQFFTSEHLQVVSNLKDMLSRCCDVVSFDVDIDEDQTNLCTGKAQLHILPDRICISKNQGYEFRILKEWFIESITHVSTTESYVNFVTSVKTVTLRTAQGIDIKSKITERLQFLSPASHQLPGGFFSAAGVTRCDRNFNVVSYTQRRRSKSCGLLMQDIHIDGLVSRANSFPLTKINSVSSQTQLSSLNHLPSSSCKSIASEEYSDVDVTSLDIEHCSDPCLATSTGNHAQLGDTEVNIQRLLNLQADKAFDHEDEINGGSKETSEDYHRTPPPIPHQQMKPSLSASTEKIENTKEKFDSAMKQSVSCDKIASQCNPMEFTGTISRTRSFQIVEQSLGYKTRQRFKSDSSLARNTIKELVQPICVDLHSETTAKSDTKVESTKPSDTVCLVGNEECSLSKTKDVHCEKSPSTCTAEDGETCNDKKYYVNLPKGSRPSCYLYMNLPDLRKAPKEAVTYVNHVVMSRSMKGIYENVFGNDTACTEDREFLPPLPPPVLPPRQPPPRLPQRASRDGRRPMPLPAQPPERNPPLPPRPPRHKKDIQVQIAVFASRAIAGRMWYLRIVVMRHDPDDSTFKNVKDREFASHYHLMQTYPFSISSDIVISLKHHCPQFKLTSEDHQEVEYNIIENLVHGFWFVIEFHLEHIGSEDDQFVGNVCMEPKNLLEGRRCPVNKKFSLGITEDFERKQSCGHCEQPRRHHLREKQNHQLTISDYALRKRVCDKLDLTVHSRFNWRDVAGHLGFSPDEIRSTEDKAHRSLEFSPMEFVLTEWEQRDPACSLKRLVGILQTIQRLDIVSDLGFPVDVESS